MQKWEYLRIVTFFAPLELVTAPVPDWLKPDVKAGFLTGPNVSANEMLKQCGMNGWELVGMTSDSSGGYILYVFKRLLP